MLHHAAFYHYYAPARLGLAQPFGSQAPFCYAWVVFCPWGEQFFIVLAMINLVWGTDAQFRAKARRRLIQLACLAGACVLMQFLAWSEDISEATSFSPVLAWVLLLGVAIVARARLGLRALVAGAGGLALLVGAGFAAFGGGLPYGDHLERAMSAALGFHWDYNARPEYFIIPSAVALAVAALYRDAAGKPWRLTLPLGSLAVLPWLIWGHYTWPSPSGIFSNEYSVARTPDGALFLAGVAALVLTLMFELDRWGLGRHARQIPLLGWLGRYSLVVYLAHAVLQSRVTFPLHVYLAGRFGFTLQLTDPVVLGSMAVTMVFSWALIRAAQAYRNA